MAFVVYRSSAGSGKTYSLVLEYLKMVLKEPASFRHILAITFTNKAANEMRERVMQALGDLSGSRPHRPGGAFLHLQRELLEDTGFSLEDLSRRAGEALSLILHHYSEFSVGTIDSFSHRIIRSFAHDFGLPVSFSVEMESDELLATAVDLLLERAGLDKELTRILVSFLESRMEEDRGWNIDRLLTEFAGLLLDEEGKERIGELSALTLEDFHRISSRLHSRIRDQEKDCRDLGEEGLRLIDREGIPHSSFYHGNTGIPAYFRNLSQGSVGKLAPNTRVMAALEEDKWAGPKASGSDLGSIERIKQPLREVLDRCLVMKETHLESYNLWKLLLQTIYPLAVLNEIGRVLEGFKRQQNLVHISEFNSRIARIVMGEPVPFIYERLGEKYHHILVDEFQDTSRLQWLNLVPLVENALAGGYFNLVVGDGKQAIYRWRNGDVTQFTSLPLLPERDQNPLIRQREVLFARFFSERRLGSNFRSARGIVEFNNRFFRWLSEQLAPGLQEVYRDLEQAPRPDLEGGYISLEFIAGGGADISYADLTINRTEEIIRTLLETGFSRKEVAVLCRTNRQAGQIARELILRGIEVVSSESLLLTYSPEVRFVTEMIRFLFEPQNAILRASLVNFLYCRDKLPKETEGLHALLTEIGNAKHPDENLVHILDRNGLQVDTGFLSGLPVYDLCETVIRTFGLNRTADPYIQFFLDAILTFSERGRQGAADFLEWWEMHKSTLSIVVPEGVDAVRIMTIHKAKGLEFRIVIFPFADESIRKTTRDYLWVTLPSDDVQGLKTAFLQSGKQLLETPYAGLFQEEQERTMLDLVNTLYVVMTRPKEQLYILSAPPPKKAEELKSLPVIFSAYLKEMAAWEEGRTHYTFGTFSAAGHTTEKNSDRVRTLTELPSTDWRRTIRIRRRAPQYWDPEDPSGRVDFGTRVHALLARIRVADDLDRTIRQVLHEGVLDPGEAHRVRAAAASVIGNPLLEKYFSPGVTVLNEPDILQKSGETFRPDRVVLDGETVVVIDYKTGRRSDSHRIQVDTYGRLLEEMGYMKVTKLLVYLGDRIEVEKV